MSMKIITLRYDPVWRALEWAKKNCPGYITNRVKKLPNRDNPTPFFKDLIVIDYYFNTEQEALLFALRWAEELFDESENYQN